MTFSDRVEPGSTKGTDHFSTEHLMRSLGQRTVASTKRTLLAQMVKFVLQVASIAVLARLLLPEDFGLVAMVTVVTALLTPLVDGGLSVATIQRRDLTHAQVSGLFWVNCLLGTLLCLAIAASAPLLARLYDEPELLPVTLALSLGFVVSSISLQSSALLKRQMRYGVIAAVDVISMFTSIASGVALAAAGIGHWALVAMALIRTCTSSVLLIALCGWMPGRPVKGSGLRPLLSFGLSMAGADLVGRASGSLTPFAVGLVAGPHQLGLFNRAQTIVSLPTSQLLPPIMSVVQGALARVAHDPARFRRAIESLLGKVLVPSVFVTLLTAVHADWLVLVALGADWTEATIYIRLLAVFTLVEPVAAVVATAIIAIGFPGALLRWRLISITLICASIGVGVMWGAAGVVAAVSISGILLRLFGLLYFASRYLPLPFYTTVNIFRPYILIVPIMLIWLLTMQHLLDDLYPFVALLTSTLLSLVLYMALIFAVPETRQQAKSILTTLFGRSADS